MKSAPIPDFEAERLSALRRYDILDSLPEDDYDSLVRLVAHICRTPIAYISFIDADRQWFKSRLGITEEETSREVAFCAHTILQKEPLVIPDASVDERFHDNPLVTGSPGIRLYAGVPLQMPDGNVIGSLCAVDTVPRNLSDDELQALRDLASHVVNLLELRRRNAELDELSTTKTRLLAILAHDVGNSLSSLDSLVRLASDGGIEGEELREILKAVPRNLVTVRELLESILIWAQSHVDSYELHYTDVALASLVSRIREELLQELERKANTLVMRGNKELRLKADVDALAFVVRNLVANANKFTKSGTITVEWTSQAPADASEMSRTTVSVSDTGQGFDTNELQLFDWDKRPTREGTDGEKGHGLGLLFVRDFILRHGGTIRYESAPGEGSVFTVELPSNHPQMNR